ncbi:hypothetical protein C2845_PM13G11950 [Panicum miliaceum]|uniref:Uncharacterized protein n=1 Tax=Panicum miliaceum TaxID=4540 RepID=A0A3L6RKM5_PANMI|nr:hypothetical protein C2845_PM13G11950 [Panicum miliaceum]
MPSGNPNLEGSALEAERSIELEPLVVDRIGGRTRQTKLEAALSTRETARAGAIARRSEMLGKTSWAFSNVAGELQKELMDFLVTSNGDWEQAPAHLAPLLKEIGNGI